MTNLCKNWELILDDLQNLGFYVKDYRHYTEQKEEELLVTLKESFSSPLPSQVEFIKKIFLKVDEEFLKKHLVYVKGEHSVILTSGTKGIVVLGDAKVEIELSNSVDVSICCFDNSKINLDMSGNSHALFKMRENSKAACTADGDSVADIEIYNVAQVNLVTSNNSLARVITANSSNLRTMVRDDSVQQITANDESSLNVNAVRNSISKIELKQESQLILDSEEYSYATILAESSANVNLDTFDNSIIKFGILKIIGKENLWIILCEHALSVRCENKYESGFSSFSDFRSGTEENNYP